MLAFRPASLFSNPDLADGLGAHVTETLALLLECQGVDLDQKCHSPLRFGLWRCFWLVLWGTPLLVSCTEQFYPVSTPCWSAWAGLSQQHRALPVWFLPTLLLWMSDSDCFVPTSLHSKHQQFIVEVVSLTSNASFQTFNNEDYSALPTLHVSFHHFVQIVENLITLILEPLDNHTLIFLSLCVFLKVPERCILASNIFLLSPEQTPNLQCAPNQIFNIKINCYFVDICFNVLINISFFHQNTRETSWRAVSSLLQAPQCGPSTVPSALSCLAKVTQFFLSTVINNETSSALEMATMDVEFNYVIVINHLMKWLRNTVA